MEQDVTKAERARLDALGALPGGVSSATLPPAEPEPPAPEPEPERTRATADEQADGVVWAVEAMQVTGNALDEAFPTRGPGRKFAIKQLVMLLERDARRQ